MDGRWRVLSADPEAISHLCRNLSISPLLARALINRGLGEREAGDFLNPSLSQLPSPMLLKDMDKALGRIIRAIQRREGIAIYGDYDVDGLTSTALLLLFLSHFGVRPLHHIPNRLEEGYGLNAKAIRRLKGEGAELIITVDCGVSNIREVALAKELGMDVIIIDHHEMSDQVPQALAILNPKREGCPFPYKGLASCGITFNLLAALRAGLKSDSPNLKRLLYLVALGTVADVMPLLGANRVMVKYGLEQLSGAPSVGIEALKEVSHLKGGQLNSGSVGFILAPRLNAAGRLGDATPSLRLLITEDASEARRLALELDAKNSLRQRLVEETLEEARALVSRDRWVLVVSKEGWHPGVIGVVAARLMEEFCRPAIVIALSHGLGRGSARSIPAFHIHKGLANCAHLLKGFGGHAMAGGLVIEEEKVAEFSDTLEDLARRVLSPQDLAPHLHIDGLIRFGQLGVEAVAELERLKPHGPGNPEPLFASEGVELLSPVQRIGMGGEHLKLKLRQDGVILEGIAFDMGYPPPIRPQGGQTLSLVYTPQLDRWEGHQKIQLKIRDMAFGPAPIV